MGNTAANPELTCAVRVLVQRLSLGLEATTSFSSFPFFLGLTELALNDTFSVGLEGYYGQQGTMRERREYPLGPGAAGFVKARL
jgi:hypothetical protein